MWNYLFSGHSEGKSWMLDSSRVTPQAQHPSLQTRDSSSGAASTVRGSGDKTNSAKEVTKRFHDRRNLASSPARTAHSAHRSIVPASTVNIAPGWRVDSELYQDHIPAHAKSPHLDAAPVTRKRKLTEKTHFAEVFGRMPGLYPPWLAGPALLYTIISPTFGPRLYSRGRHGPVMAANYLISRNQQPVIKHFPLFGWNQPSSEWRNKRRNVSEKIYLILLKIYPFIWYLIFCCSHDIMFLQLWVILFFKWDLWFPHLEDKLNLGFHLRDKLNCVTCDNVVLSPAPALQGL